MDDRLVAPRRAIHPRQRREPGVRGGGFRTGAQSGIVEIVLHVNMPIERMDLVNGQLELRPVAVCPPDRFFTPENRYSNTHARRIIDGATDELGRWRKRPVLRAASTLEDRHLLADLNSTDMQGLILVGNDGPGVDSFLRRLQCPFVSLIGMGRNDWGFAGPDDLPGMRQAVQHLREIGHRRIGYVSCMHYGPMFARRFDAFKYAMTEIGLAIDPADVMEGALHVANIAKDAERLLARADRPTAVIGCYDGAAIGVMRAAERVGLSVPKDLSVIGFGNQDIAEMIRPGLTSVDTPNYEIGRAAVRLLMMERVRSESTMGLSVTLPTSLVHRMSTDTAPATGAIEGEKE